jgi:hypothetical protein
MTLKNPPVLGSRKLALPSSLLGSLPPIMIPLFFTSNSSDHAIMILIYVDGILVTGNNPAHAQQCITQLQNIFSLLSLSPTS